MRRFVAWQNITRYRQLLDTETDERRRNVIRKLLGEEETVWAGLLDVEPMKPHRHESDNDGGAAR